MNMWARMGARTLTVAIDAGSESPGGATSISGQSQSADHRQITTIVSNTTDKMLAV